MDQDRRHQNYGQQFGFDHYDLPPGRKNIIEKIFGEDLASKLRSPIFAAAALLLTGAAFAGIIIASYPGEQQSGEIPTVKADTFAYKEAPSEAGGMNIPNRDTTIFQTMAEGQNSNEAPPIENLLADEQPTEKLAAFQKQVEALAAEDAQPADPTNIASLAPTTNPAPPADEPKAQPQEKPAAISKTANIAVKKIIPSPEPAQDGLVSASAASAAAKAAAGASASVSETADDLDIPDPVPPSAALKKAPPQPPAGSNPETLEYVRSVLDRRDGSAPDIATVKPPAEEQKTASVAAERVSKVEPASGMAVTAGSHYIQLGSVSSESGAASEWNKLKRDHSTELAGLSYRVQRADLDRGTFFRIQAGPISKESAQRLCDSIKTRKPGACLVTQ